MRLLTSLAKLPCFELLQRKANDDFLSIRHKDNPLAGKVLLTAKKDFLPEYAYFLVV